MAPWSFASGALCLVLLAALCAASASASASTSDTAFLVVRKKAALAKVKTSERVTVSISLHNAGASTAYDVSVNDETWPEDKFTVVTGNLSQSWEKLDAGGSLAHTFVLEPKVKGPFFGSPAVVKYRMAAKSVLQEAYSTPIPELDIFSDKPAENRFQWMKDFGVKYGPLMIVLTFVGGFTYLLVTPSKPKKFSKSGKRRR